MQTKRQSITETKFYVWSTLLSGNLTGLGIVLIIAGWPWYIGILFSIIGILVFIWIQIRIKKNMKRELEEFKQLLAKLYDTKGE